MATRKPTLWYNEEIQMFICLLVDDRILTELNQMDSIHRLTSE